MCSKCKRSFHDFFFIIVWEKIFIHETRSKKFFLSFFLSGRFLSFFFPSTSPSHSFPFNSRLEWREKSIYFFFIGWNLSVFLGLSCFLFFYALVLHNVSLHYFQYPWPYFNKSFLMRKYFHNIYLFFLLNLIMLHFYFEVMWVGWRV